jgi:hypothetical protein
VLCCARVAPTAVAVRAQLNTKMAGWLELARLVPLSDQRIPAGSRSEVGGGKITSQHFGVCWNKGKCKWRASSTSKVDGKKKHLGYFAEEEEAAVVVRDYTAGIRKTVPYVKARDLDDGGDRDDGGREKEYAVQEICGTRTNRQGRVEYLVRWLGYSAKDDTWEPAECLQNAQPALEKFRSRLGKVGEATVYQRRYVAWPVA